MVFMLVPAIVRLSSPMRLLPFITPSNLDADTWNK